MQYKLCYETKEIVIDLVVVAYQITQHNTIINVPAINILLVKWKSIENVVLKTPPERRDYFTKDFYFNDG